MGASCAQIVGTHFSLEEKSMMNCKRLKATAMPPSNLLSLPRIIANTCDTFPQHFPVPKPFKRLERRIQVPHEADSDR